MTSPHQRSTSPSRRALVRGAAWATPVVAFAAPVHAQVASPPCLTTVTSVSRCNGILIPLFRRYTVCFSNDCPPGSASVTVSNVTVAGDAVTGSVTISPGQSGCLTSGWIFSVFPPGTVTVTYSVDGSPQTPVTGLPVQPCGTTARATTSDPPDGTTVTLEDGRTLTVKDGRLVDESGRVITSEKDLQQPAPKASQPEKPAGTPTPQESTSAQPTPEPTDS